jgi:hypothetical protein
VSDMIDEHRGPGWGEISEARYRSPCSKMTPVQFEGGVTLCEEPVHLCSRARQLTDDLIPPLRDERVRVVDLCSALMICPDQGPSLHRRAARWLAATGAGFAEQVDQQLACSSATIGINCAGGFAGFYHHDVGLILRVIDHCASTVEHQASHQS